MDQKTIILQELRRGPLTAREALIVHGIGRLAARVQELRKSGVNIDTELVTTKNRHGQPTRVARYHLNKKGNTVNA